MFNIQLKYSGENHPSGNNMILTSDLIKSNAILVKIGHVTVVTIIYYCFLQILRPVTNLLIHDIP